jgi:hypothetical protein
MASNDVFSIYGLSYSLTYDMTPLSPTFSGPLWDDDDDETTHTTIPYEKEGLNTQNTQNTHNTQHTHNTHNTHNTITGGFANYLHPWNEKRPQWTYIFHWASDERLLFESDAMQIKLDQVHIYPYMYILLCIYFYTLYTVFCMLCIMYAVYAVCYMLYILCIILFTYRICSSRMPCR